MDVDNTTIGGFTPSRNNTGSPKEVDALAQLFSKSAVTTAPSKVVKLKQTIIDKLILDTRIKSGEKSIGYLIIDFLKAVRVDKITPNTKSTYGESAASLAAYDNNSRFFIQIGSLNGTRSLSMETTYGKTKCNVLEIAVKRNSIIKDKKTLDILGCSISELKIHLEKMFKPNMNWKNYGKGGWHIDHIIPLASAKNNIDAFYKLCHYSNLQPLWESENCSKGSKIL